MCGIAAIFAYGASAPPVDRAEVFRMREQMHSRGPDGEGEWFSPDGRVGFGHQRLSIIDLSPAGAQPMWNADRSLALIFNGEIYNYAELRSQLSGNGYEFQSHCDAEVLLALYETRGESMMNTLRGMYAFAIWDARKEGLFIARDPFGIKPIYYSDNGHTIRVASQVKALGAGGNIDLAPDPAGHVGYFLWGHVPDPYTMFRNIRSLPAGSSMWIDRSGSRSPKVFCNTSTLLREAEEAQSRKSKVEGRNSSLSHLRSPTSDLLRSSLNETVRYHLVADVPVGVFLSSGLDSTAIAALAAEQGGDLRTVTLGFEEYKGTENNEVPLAEEFARRCAANHQTIWVSRADFEAERNHLFEAMDIPTTDGVNTFFVSLAAKRADLKVALSGVGGDELFASYPSFEEIPRSVRWLKAFNSLRSVGRDLRTVSAPIVKHFTSPKYAGMFEYGGSYSGAYLLRRGMFMPWELPELLDPDLVREGWAELQTLLRLDETVDGISNPRLKISALEVTWYMRNQLLRDADWAGMGHSVEIRVPFVDIDFLKEIAPVLVGENPPSKRDMAAAASPLITTDMLNRRKTGFQIPVRDWLRDESRRAEFEIAGPGHRGLRGWAREVYSHFVSSALPLRPTRRKSRKRATVGTVGEGGSFPNASSRETVSFPSASGPATTREAHSFPYRGSSGGPGREANGVRSKAVEVLMLVSDAFGGFGGIAKFNRDFITALCSSPGIERVIAIPRVAPENIGPLPPKLSFVSAALAGKSQFIRAVTEAARQFRSKNAGPIIFCGHIHLLPAALLARKICGGPIYLIVHGVEVWKPLHNPLMNRCVRHVDDFIAVSTITRRRFLRWARLRLDQGIVLPNCVDLSAFTPGEKSHALLVRYGLQGRAVLLTLGRLASEERYKGFDEVLESLSDLAREIPNISYLIVGDGPDRPRLEQKAEQLGVAERVIFTGRISENEKADHYRLADVYVMPSSGEGFGIVYLEALACGVPVIGSKIDGSRDALRGGRLGMLVNPRDPAELRAAILKTLSRKQIDPAELRKGVEYFSTERFRERVWDIVDVMTTDLVAPNSSSSASGLIQITSNRG